MKKNKGLTLIELLITVAIVGILVAIAYPQYQHYITRTYRTRALQNLLLLSKDMQHYYRQQQNYLGATIVAIASNNITDDKHYRYQIKELTAQSYQLIAIPQSTQAKRDPHCGNLMIDQLGEKNISGNAKLNECWLT